MLENNNTTNSQNSQTPPVEQLKMKVPRSEISAQSASPSPAPAQTATQDGTIYPRIGLALGSGATKAISQFGLVQRLVANNIKISSVMGSSMGAIVGAVFALGLEIDPVLEKCLQYANASSISNLSNLNIFHESVFKKDYEESLLKEIFGDATFADCKIPFAVTAVDLEAGKEIVIKTGPLVSALRASSSIPGVFEPVFIDGQYLVDGGLLEDCPISSIRRFQNCDLVVGCAINDNRSRQFMSGYIYRKFYAKKKKTNFLEEKLSQVKNNMSMFTGIIARSIDILRDALFEYKIAEGRPDILIHLNTEKVGIFDFQKIRDLVKFGAKAMDDRMPELNALIERKKKELNSPTKNANL